MIGDIRFMDMVFKRYANPMILLGQMIRSRRLTEFVGEFIRIHNKEIEEQTTWDVWLHKVFDLSYQDFLSKINTKTSTETDKKNEPTAQELESIVKDSWGTLNSFCPE